MLDCINNDIKMWDWKAQLCMDTSISLLISKIDSWEYRTKKVKIDLEVIDLSNYNFTINSIYDFILHSKLAQNSDLKYPVILNNKWHIIDWRHRLVKAILEWKKHIDWVMIIEQIDKIDNTLPEKD